jgi:hypothetical protein
MKKILFLIFSLLLIFALIDLRAEEEVIGSATKEKVKKSLLQKYGESQKFRIEKGVDQAASFWKKDDGTREEFEQFCEQHFVGSSELLETNFKRLETNLEVLNGHFDKIVLDLKRPLDLDWGEILPLDMIFGQFNPSAHITEDLFKNKIAFFVLLNFPRYSLFEKTEFSPKWSRKDWAYARMGDSFASRVPARVFQKISQISTEAEAYISDYNIYMGKLIDEKYKTYFPPDLRLITHWGIRDELKARYADPEGLFKQKMIYEVMLRIIKQEIPEIVINSSEYSWNPFTNKVYKDREEVASRPEPLTRYKHLLNCFLGMRMLDPYYPALPTHIKRKFELEREIPEAEVEALFTSFISSPQVRKVSKLISNRLGRKLQPFDIWYTGFKSGSSIREEELDKIVATKYPNIKAFQGDLENILIKLGFSKEQAGFIAAKIIVDPARGSGHGWGAEMKSENAHLRTRFTEKGMDYKGYNIAIHELGHNVEQTLTLQKVDYYMLHGVPNTAFTEAFAFVFQDRNLELLGIKSEDKNQKYMEALDSLWNTYEIMGVSLVDMKVWNWLYNNPDATAEKLKEATISIANDVWNRYYADVFGIKDLPILAIYSHMIDAALYLPDYPVGHVIAFQIGKYLEGKNLGEEMERMCVAGNIIPQAWMKNAVGSEISTKPLLDAVDEALKYIK